MEKTSHPNFTIYLVEEIDDQLLFAFQRLIPQLSKATLPTREHLAEIVTSNDSALFAARLTLSREIVGAAALATYRVPTGRKAWIEDVVVDKAWRGHGIGAALTQMAIDHALQLGVSDLKLTSNPIREAANRLYERMGFIRHETNHYYYPINEKEVLEKV
jgi:ribosomal protein S18 acetylase RimI-like enzyme